MSYQKCTLAIVFADISKSTHLFEVFGDMRARGIVGHTLSLLADVTKQHGGAVIKTIGDEVMCTFESLENALDAATQMPMVVKEDPTLSDVGISIKVGLHFGEVLRDHKDVYGDAVNLASRMVDLAKPDQIITTKTTIEKLPMYLHGNLRKLGTVPVRGRQEDIEIYELLWQPDTTDLTVMHGPISPAVQTIQACLELTYGDQQFRLEKKQLPFSLGRGEKNNLVVRHQSVSRNHASIEYRQGKFVLIDRSTNGTFLHIDGEETVFLHRDQLWLRSEGKIMLGQDGEDQDAEAIHFHCTP